jgi:ribosome recycling factor
VRKAEKDSTVSEDEAKKSPELIFRKLTDKYIKEVDEVTAGKEKEVMEV